jgi:hypothetical protein
MRRSTVGIWLLALVLVAVLFFVYLGVISFAGEAATTLSSKRVGSGLVSSAAYPSGEPYVSVVIVGRDEKGDLWPPSTEHPFPLAKPKTPVQ